MKKSEYPEIMVYGLYDPDTGDLRYIGKTCRGWRRIREHLCISYAKDESHKSRWLRTLFSANKLPTVKVLLVCETNEQALDAEVTAIKDARDRGERLTNITDGGEGFSGLVVTPESSAKCGAALHKRWIGLSDDARAEELERIHRNLHSPETRAKISKKLRGRKQAPTPALLASYEARRGCPVSDETRAKLSKAHKGRVKGPISDEVKKHMSDAWTPEKREARSKKYTGRKLSEETIAKMTASRIGRPCSAETREKIAAAQRGVPRPYAANPSEETRKKISAAHKGKKIPRDLVDRRAASLREYYKTHPVRVPSEEELKKRSISMAASWALRKAAGGSPIVVNESAVVPTEERA